MSFGPVPAQIRANIKVVMSIKVAVA